MSPVSIVRPPPAPSYPPPEKNNPDPPQLGATLARGGDRPEAWPRTASLSVAYASGAGLAGLAAASEEESFLVALQQQIARVGLVGGAQVVGWVWLNTVRACVEGARVVSTQTQPLSHAPRADCPCRRVS